MSSEDRDDQDPLKSFIAEILESEQSENTVDRDALLKRYPEHAESLHEFFANHDRMKATASLEEPALPPNVNGLDAPTIPLGQGSQQEATIPPQPSGDDATIPTTEGASQPAEPNVGDQVRYFGDYELLEGIARGGMGVVFRARQMNLNRIVALKMILAGQFAGEEDVQRFYTEAEAAAQLDHAGIVPIFEIGQHLGQHYFSMGYVEGASLAQKVADGPLPPREAAELVKKICEAMAYAHERGVIHRDLKPANILIDSNGQPKVTDFGLAKKTETDSGLTGTGQILGTPAYMPPEQASGKTYDVGPLADVYSLGAILYCLVTGRPPFQAASPMDTLLQVLDKEPAAPSQLNAGVEQDVETICLKCLQKDSAKRYDSAGQLADDLNRYLNHEPICARPVSRAERAYKWCRRNPTVASLLACVVLLLIGGSVVSTGFAIQSRRNAERANKAQEKAELVAYSSTLRRVQEYLEESPGETLVALSDEQLCPPHLHDFAWSYLRARAQESAYIFRGSRQFKSATYSPNGKWLAAGCANGDVQMWNTSHHTHRTLSGHEAQAFCLDISPDGSTIATGHHDGKVVVRELQSGEIQRIYADNQFTEIMDVTYSPDGELLVAVAAATKSGMQVGELIVWNRRTGSRLLEFRDKTYGKLFAAVFVDGSRKLAVGASTKILIWDLETGRVERMLSGHGNWIWGMDAHETLLASASFDRTVRLWDLESGECLATLEGHPHWVLSAAFSPDGKTLATCCFGRVTHVWDLAEMQSGKSLSPVQTYREHFAGVNAVAFHPDGKQIATSGDDGTVRIWNFSKTRTTNPAIQTGVYACRAATAPVVAVLQRDGTIVVRDTARDAELCRIEDQNRPRTMALSWDGTCLATLAGDNRIRVWDTGKGSLLGFHSEHRKYVHAICFDPEAANLLTAGEDEVVILWDVRQKRVVQRINNRHWVHSIAFAPDKRRVVFGMGNSDTAVRIFAYESLKENPSFPAHDQLYGHAGSVNAVSVSANGELLISTSSDFTARIWSLGRLAENATLRGHRASITALGISPDGRNVVTGDTKGRVIVWETTLGLELCELKGPSTEITSLHFSRDGRQVVAGTQAGRLWTWLAEGAIQPIN